MIIIEIPFKVSTEEFLLVWDLMSKVPKPLSSMTLEQLQRSKRDIQDQRTLTDSERSRYHYLIKRLKEPVETKKYKTDYDYSHNKNDRKSSRVNDGKKKVRDMTTEEYDKYRRDYYASNKEKIKEQSKKYYWKKKNKK